MYRRILVILFPVIGDVLLGTPLLSALRRRYPDAQIDVLVRAGCAIALEGNPDIQRVIETSRHPGLAEYWQLGRTLLGRYDLAVSNALSDRAALYALAAAPERVTWARPEGTGMGWKRLVYQRWSDEPRGPTHPLLANAFIARVLELPYDGLMALPCSPDAARRVQRLLGNDPAQLVILHPAARMSYKRWQREGWRTIASHMQQRGYRVVVTGGKDPDELEYLHDLFEGLRDIVFAAGQLQLGDLGTLFRRAGVFIGVDTSATHMAAGTGLPTVALFGPEDPGIWGPWPRGPHPTAPNYAPTGDCAAGNVQVLHSSLPCVPCRRKGCDNHCDSRAECLDEITASRVLAAVDRLIDPPPATPALTS